MNAKQKKIAERLRKALIAVGEADLSGGVYDGAFCLWPSGMHPKHEIGFFDEVEKCGIILYTPGVDLDGGAGV